VFGHFGSSPSFFLCKTKVREEFIKTWQSPVPSSFLQPTNPTQMSLETDIASVSHLLDQDKPSQ
jgi:hypothetical protein